MEQTLVLDVGWQPIAKIDWTRAVTLLWEKKVEVVTSYDDKMLHSASWTIPMPAVIRFFREIKRRRKGVKFSRENLLIRDHFLCQYCGKQVDRRDATYDHVVPRRAGGATNFYNILISCVDCNQRKGGRTPSQAGMKIIPCRVPNCPYHRTGGPVKPKSLPEHMFVAFEWHGSYPKEWKEFLQTAVTAHQYWNDDLEETD